MDNQKLVILVLATAFVAVLIIRLLLVFTEQQFGWQLKVPYKKIFPNLVLSQITLPKWVRGRFTLLKIALFILTVQFTLYFLTYLSFVILSNEQRGFFDSFQAIWHRWDTDSFLIIAEGWYPTEGDDRFRLVFYPFYPILVALFNTVIGNTFIAGVTVSIVFYVLAAYYLYLLVLREFDDEHTAWLSVKYLAIFPFSFFYGIAYTESLFLCLSIACVYYLRGQRFYLAGTVGMLAAFTRNQGIILFLPFIIELLRVYPIYDKVNRRFIFPKGLQVNIGASLLVLLGFILYLFINKQVSGEFFKFMEYQKINWGQNFSFFADNLQNIYSRAFNSSHGQVIGIWAPTVVVFFVFVSFLNWGVKKIPISFTAYALALLIISFSPSWLLSGPRYTAVIFIIYILLALFCAKSRLKDLLLTIFSTLSLMFYTIMFTRSIVY